MLYHIVGTLQTREPAGPQAEFREFVQKIALPSINQLVQFQSEGKLLAGGIRASSQEFIFILDSPGASHMAIRRLLFQLPIFGHCQWQVTPLESFKDWTDILLG